MNKKDEEIQRKLLELEAAVLKEAPPPPSLPTAHQHSTAMTSVGSGAPISTARGPATTVGQDLCYFLGIGLIFTGLLMFFNQVHIGSGMLQVLGLGGGGFALILVPLMVGLGWLMYDSKNKWAWLLTASVCGFIVFAVLSSLVMTFPTMTLLGTIMLLLPFAAGGALLLKGLGGPKALQDKLITKE
jgi:hypothetical protein